MTELKLKEELKVRPGESAPEYAERAKDVLNRHHEETGERVHPMATLTDEAPGETLVRLKVLSEAYDIEAAARKRQREQQGKGKDMEKDASAATEESTRSFRLKSQERDVEKAVAAFEDEKKRLYRGGVKLYADQEHNRRLGELTDGLRERVEAVSSEAARDAEGYDKEALALSYRDPLTNLTVSERERVSASMPLVREDFETMGLASLVERLRAVAAGSDKVAMFLHSRYALRRCELETARLDEASRSTGEAPVVNIDTAALRELRTAAEEIARELKDPADERKRQAVQEAAAKSRRVVTTARSKLNEADGSAGHARREHADGLRAAL
jgi:hypothetical protein